MQRTQMHDQSADHTLRCVHRRVHVLLHDRAGTEMRAAQRSADASGLLARFQIDDDENVRLPARHTSLRRHHRQDVQDVDTRTVRPEVSMQALQQQAHGHLAGRARLRLSKSVGLVLRHLVVRIHPGAGHRRAQEIPAACARSYRRRARWWTSRSAMSGVSRVVFVVVVVFYF